MSEQVSLSPIVDPARRILGVHPNMPELLDGIDEDPTQINTLFTSFDTAIQDYNAMPVNDLPEGLHHIPKIKPVLDMIPTIQEMLSDLTSDTCRSFRRTLHEMNPLMTRAEEHQPEPFIGFHVWEGASTADRLVGGIFQAYGMTIANNALGYPAPKDEKYKYRDTLLDGLIEVMVLNQNKHPNDPVLGVVKSQGWFEATNPDGTYIFSETIRKLATSVKK